MCKATSESSNTEKQCKIITIKLRKKKNIDTRTLKNTKLTTKRPPKKSEAQAFV